MALGSDCCSFKTNDQAKILRNILAQLEASSVPDTGIDYEVKAVSSTCFQETANTDNKWTRTICIPLEDGVAQAPVTYWTDEVAGTTSTTAPVAATEPCPVVSGSYVQTEPGCLSDPTTADLSEVSKCDVYAVVVNGETINISLEAGWTSEQLVAAVEAVSPGLLVSEGSGIVGAPGVSIGNMQILCNTVQFEEDFGEGGLDGARATSPNTGGTYVFVPSSSVNPENTYAVTSFADAGLDTYNNANRLVTANLLENQPEVANQHLWRTESIALTKMTLRKRNIPHSFSCGIHQLHAGA